MKLIVKCRIDGVYNETSVDAELLDKKENTIDILAKGKVLTLTKYGKGYSKIIVSKYSNWLQYYVQEQ